MTRVQYHRQNKDQQTPGDRVQYPQRTMTLPKTLQDVALRLKKE